jgi:nicotinamide riboside kinase
VVLALAAPLAFGILILTSPDILASWVDDGVRSMLAAVVRQPPACP